MEQNVWSLRRKDFGSVVMVMVTSQVSSASITLHNPSTLSNDLETGIIKVGR